MDTGRDTFGRYQFQTPLPILVATTVGRICNTNQDAGVWSAAKRGARSASTKTYVTAVSRSGSAKKTRKPLNDSAGGTGDGGAPEGSTQCSAVRVQVRPRKPGGVRLSGHCEVRECEVQRTATKLLLKVSGPVLSPGVFFASFLQCQIYRGEGLQPSA